MEKEEKNFKERERYRNKIKDEIFKENKRKKDLENLEFDHIDDSKKEHNVGNAVRNTREVFWNEVGKCQLLCVNCHNKRTTAQKRAKQKLWLSLPLEERERLLSNELQDT